MAQPMMCIHLCCESRGANDDEVYIAGLQLLLVKQILP
jgi:hypothetical protein